MGNGDRDRVVRVFCDGCVYAKRMGYSIEYYECSYLKRYVDPDDYCKWGEEKEDGTRITDGV